MKNKIEKDSLLSHIDSVMGGSRLMSAMKGYLAAILVDLDSNRIVGATPVAEEMFGYSLNELLNNNVNKLIQKQFHENHLQAIKLFKSNPAEKMMVDRRVPGIKKDGTEFTFIVWLIPTDENEAMCVLFH